VFKSAAAFNADISKWETGMVTNMYASTSTSVSTLFVHLTVSLIWFLISFLIHPCCLLYFCIISCHPPFRAHCFLHLGSVSICCCLQCRHFQVGDWGGAVHASQYVHLCFTLFVHWTVSLICFFDFLKFTPDCCCLHHFWPSTFSCPLFSTFRVVGSVSRSCCLQCRHFQVEDEAGERHEIQYVHLCFTTVCSLDGVAELFF